MDRPLVNIARHCFAAVNHGGPLPPLYTATVVLLLPCSNPEQVGLDGGVGAVRIAYDNVEAGRDDLVVNGCRNPTKSGDALFSGTENASAGRQNSAP